MLKIICDRCGREILTTATENDRKVVLTNFGVITKCDLCKSCLLDVKEFITNPQTDCAWK